MFGCLLSVLLCFTGANAQESRPVITTLEELREACKDRAQLGRTFDIEGDLLEYHRRNRTREWILSVGNGTCSHDFFEKNDPGSPATNLPHSALNDRVRIQGYLYEYEGLVWAGYKKAEFLFAQPFNRISSPRELFNPESPHNLFRFRGIIRDAFQDEGDPNFIYMTMNCQGETLHIMMYHLPVDSPFDARPYLGAEAIATGVCHDTDDCLRHQIGRLIIVSGPEHIQIVQEPESRTALTPDIDSLKPMPPSDLARLGIHQAEGQVLAVWHNDTVLLRTKGENIVKVTLESGVPPVRLQTIRASGLPETDLYFLNLTHASWSCVTSETGTPSRPTGINARELLTNARGDQQIQIRAHGSSVRMTGIIRHLPQMRDQNAAMQVESDGSLVPVDVSSCLTALDGLSIGSVVAVTGTCVIDITNNGQDASTPKARGFFIVLNSPSDLVVISRPLWWTPGRLLTLLGIFAAALLGVIGWNVSLNRRAKAKGRELAAEQLAHVTSELKVNERTRLAVELHDALSQTLSGVSMQIDTAAGFAEGKTPAIAKCLGLASRTIDACRMELRNTLWDLRSAALDEPCMDAAIRKTLCQNLAGIDLSVRFNVPRETFSDNTAHAVLKIIRELATNALRHGKSTSLKIAGTIDDGKLLFSVRDNGCGFDPDLAPGISQGHFGLQGISERLERLNGEMKIDSTPGKGAKVTVILPIPQSEN